MHVWQGIIQYHYLEDKLMGIVLAKNQEYMTYFKESIYGKFDPKKIITNLKSDFTLNKP